MPFIEIAQKRVLFIHIPRTGGTSIENWLRALAPLSFFSFGVPPFSKVTPQHYPFQAFRTLFPDGHFDYVFTVVRNPFDRITSEYRVRKLLAKESFFKGFPSFSNWLEDTFARGKNNLFILDNHIRPQVQFVSKEVKIFHFESGLPNIISAVCAETSLPMPSRIEQSLSTAALGGQDEWDIPDVSRVVDFYRRDFEVFNYLFEPPQSNPIS